MVREKQCWLGFEAMSDLAFMSCQTLFSTQLNALQEHIAQLLQRNQTFRMSECSNQDCKLTDFELIYVIIDC